jgi:MYXO-CTERM domain-containing protein
MAGTFAVTIDQSNGHIGESDTLILEDSLLTNTTRMALNIAGIATVHLLEGNARFLDFASDGAGHIGAGGLAVANADTYLEAALLVSGAYTTTWSTAAWAGTLLPFEMNFATSATASDVFTATLAGTFAWSLYDPALGLTLTHDLIIDVEGTAHVVPDPGLGGLTALGLGGAGAWLRRRRS